MGIYQTFSFWFLHFSLCGVVVFLQLQTLKRRDCNETGTVISLKKETDQGSWSNGSNNSSEINLDLSRTPVMNSPVSSSLNGKTLLPTSLKPTSITQLLQCSSRSDLQDESFCNMFHIIDEQQNFWPWPDHQQQQQHQFH